MQGSRAVKGWRVCPRAGARGGAPKGPASGMYRHGLRTREVVECRRAPAELMNVQICLFIAVLGVRGNLPLTGNRGDSAVEPDVVNLFHAANWEIPQLSPFGRGRYRSRGQPRWRSRSGKLAPP